MSVTVEQNGAVGRRLMITIPGDRIESEMEQQLKGVAKSAKIKGFRPGKAPSNMVRREYGAAVRDDVISELMRSHYSEALSSESLNPVDLPKFEDGTFTEDGSFTFAANLEVFPEVDPQGTEGLVVKRPKVEIGDTDIDAVLERMQKQKAEWVATERAAQKGDRISINFEGLVEGEPFEGNRGENVPIELGAGEMIPGFETGLTGIKKGETRQLDIDFPEDYRATELAGKKATFEVTATALEEQQMPEIDDAFAATFGCDEGVSQLRERVRKNMESELEARIREDMHDQIGDQLIDANPVEVPTVLVEQEIERRQRQLMRQLGLEEDAAKIPNLPREPYEEAAQRHVRLGLVMSALVQREAFQPDPARVEKHIDALCAQLDDPATGARELRADNKAMRNIEALVLEDMIYDWLIEQSTVTDEPKEFLAYMEPKKNGEQAEDDDDE